MEDNISQVEIPESQRIEGWIKIVKTWWNVSKAINIKKKKDSDSDLKLIINDLRSECNIIASLNELKRGGDKKLKVQKEYMLCN